MGERVGRSFSLSLPRRFICDLLHFAQKVPTVPVQRRLVYANHFRAPRGGRAVLVLRAFMHKLATRHRSAGRIIGKSFAPDAEDAGAVEQHARRIRHDHTDVVEERITPAGVPAFHNGYNV